MSRVILPLIVSMMFFAASCESKKSARNSENDSQQTAGTDAAAAGIQASTNPEYMKAPDFDLKDINGKSLKLSDYRGKVVILDFWATWCPPCKAEIPSFIELHKEYKGDLVVIGLALENDLAKVKTFYMRNNMNYPVALSPQDIPLQYGGIQGIPTTFIIDREGNIRDRYVGFRPKTMFEEAYNALK
ncbi:MAG TPA: TlpA disulfide reductase family protein [Candidatus Goldiibacteriota bacterium]|mgnify:CR=1 FL=1|nr:TlpA disulfide reductase family protein [Candidatus Goldiibacteriota bacterium]